MSGLDDDQRQGQRTKVKRKWQRHFFNATTARILISIGRLIIEIVRWFDE
jgi:hypothetical protein